MPAVVILAAAMCVLFPPTVIPSASTDGIPSRITPISVVVPPMSTTIASFRPVIATAPIMLAVGPDITVSTGLLLAADSPIREPFPRTTISGASISKSSSTDLTASMSSLITGIRPALITQVDPRTLNPRLEDSS